MGNPADPSDPDRYRSQAHRTASERLVPTVQARNEPFISVHTADDNHATSTKTGGLSNDNGRGGRPSRPAFNNPQPEGGEEGGGAQLDGAIRDGGPVDSEKSALHETATTTATRTAAAGAAPPHKSEDASSGDSAIVSADETDKKKPNMLTRIVEGSKRFGGHFKDAIFHSWINVLLVAVPAGIAAEAAGLNPGAVFGINAVAIIPLAGLLTKATESVAARVGDSWGALLNISFGNAVELIIFIIALVKDEINIVQASLLGSILANLLLILGMAFLLGGLRFREQIYNSTVTQMSACLLSLSVMSLLLPTAFHASFNQASSSSANTKVLEVSRGTSVVLLIVYGLYLLFQLKSHAYMYESTPQEIIDEESHPGVLADIMNSSSSSDSSTSSDSSSTDSDGSGSVATTTRRMKRMFKHKKRRKSSGGSTSSGRTAPGLTSMLSSPSTQEREDYFDHAVASHATSRRGSTALAVAAQQEEADADHEDNGVSRVFDWATKRNISHDGSKSPEPKRRHKKHSKKKDKKQRRRDEAKNEAQTAHAEENPSEFDEQPSIHFANDVQVIPSQQEQQQREPAVHQSPRLAFNMRQLSSRAVFRPAMPKMLSNNVFVQPPPQATPAPRPVPMPRLQSENNLRRTNSLPDRLNRQSTPRAANASTGMYTETIPPHQMQRYPLHKVTPKPVRVKTENEEDAQPEMSKTAAIVLLLASTALVAVCAEFMVDAIPDMLGDGSQVSEAFIGLIILPIVGNAAEHVTAVTVATKNKMDLAIGVAVGSSIQIALFVTPVVVLLGWILDTQMSLYFNLFETVSLFVTVFVVNFLVLDGRSNYLEGALLMAAYVIIAVVAFFYPDSSSQSSIGGGAGD